MHELKRGGVMELLLFWIVGAILVAVVASSKRRSGARWFFLSLLISPLLTLIAVAAMPRIEPPTPQEPVKICPRCAEKVKLAAVVCRFCGHEFGSGDPSVEPRRAIPLEKIKPLKPI
jgi:hypothetical protein